MTEAEWLAGSDPLTLLSCLVRKFDDVSGRKMRLFACSCCRRIWHFLRREESRAAVEVAEKHADELVGRKELGAVRQAALAIVGEFRHKPCDYHAAKAAAHCAEGNGRQAGRNASDHAAKTFGDVAYESALRSTGSTGDVWQRAIQAEDGVQILLFRDIFGNPFRPSVVEPSLLSMNGGTILRLAETIYAERDTPSGILDNARLAVLADALEEAGCTDAAILEHLRGPGPHVRGCWVIDILLCKQ